MVSVLKNWLLGLIGAALFCTIAAELTPKGAVKRVQSVLSGVVLASALLLPLLRMDASDYALHLAESRAEAAAVTQEAEEISERLNRRSIEAQLEAYILDKAQTLGAAVRNVSVSVRWSTEGVWVPEEVTLDGQYHAALAAAIEGELGIPGTRQSWRTE